MKIFSPWSLNCYLYTYTNYMQYTHTQHIYIILYYIILYYIILYYIILYYIRICVCKNSSTVTLRISQVMFHSLNIVA